MHRIGIMANAGKDAALEVARAADQFLSGRGATVLLQPHIAEGLGCPERGLPDRDIINSDAVLVLGGDGTILATSRKCGPRGTPMLPVHLGRFGFLTEIAPQDLTVALDGLLDGRYAVDERMMLAGEVVRGNLARSQTQMLALNDIVIAHGPLSRVLHIRLSIDDRYVTTYAADGLIIATPTGSTAYSLSAGGPLVHPSLQTILITPICAHTLTSRALLVPPDTDVSVEVERDPDDIVRVTVDGQIGYPFHPGDQLCIRRAAHPARIITVGGPDFYDKLQSKLRWGERIVY